MKLYPEGFKHKCVSEFVGFLLNYTIQKYEIILYGKIIKGDYSYFPQLTENVENRVDKKIGLLTSVHYSKIKEPIKLK